MDNPFKFLVAQNCIKKELDFFFFKLRKLLRFWGQFTSTALVIDRHLMSNIALSVGEPEPGKYVVSKKGQLQ